MDKGIKISLWTIGIGAALYLVFKGAQKVVDANTFINNLQFSIKPGDSPIRMTGINNIQLKLDVFITNPTKMTLSFEKPIVTIMYGDSILAQSKIPDPDKNNDVTIKPRATTKISMTFDISILSNWSTWIAIGKQLGKDTSSATGVSDIANIVSANANAVLEMLKVKILTYIGDTPIDYVTTIV